MCDELGQDEYMNAYIMESAGTFLCRVETKDGCSDREVQFIDTWSAKSQDDISKERNRIENIPTLKLSPVQKEWFGARVRALRQLDKTYVTAGASDKEL